eukprot:TRINITY_DN25079_c0_g1_i1.p1 TRINITY_DN25079_c0_g1~~TRINITY_DN25079_c0_g1_i1.p1  ORF type:complete len:612 (+),score=179.34 TRINITY_DN25079_c0_g1_i1:54-1889(+)
MAYSRALCLAGLLAAACGTVINVYPTGAKVPGGKYNVGSLVEARDAAREAEGAVVRVQLHPGRHLLSETLALDSARDSRVTWAGAAGATVSGGQRVVGWAPCPSRKNYLCAPLPFTDAALAQPRHLFVNGRRAGRSAAPASVVAAFANPLAVDPYKYIVNASVVGTWDAASAGDVEMVFTSPAPAQWCEPRCTVENVTGFGAGPVYMVYMKQPCFAIAQMKPCNQGTHAPTRIENTGLPAEMGRGDFWLDRKGKQLVYYPLVGEQAAALDAWVPVVEELLVVQRVFGTTFANIVFEHATWRRPNEGLGYIEQQGGALVSAPTVVCDDKQWKPMPSNIQFVGTRGVRIVNCTFRHLGAGALQFDGGAHDNEVVGSTFYDISGTAVQIGRYNTYNETDRSKQERGNSVTHCNISNVATEFHGNNGLSVGYSAYTTLAHNVLTDLTYSGISVGWGWAREPNSYAGFNRVEGNIIRGYKLQKDVCALGDGGGIYALGTQPGSVMARNWISNMGAGRGGGAFYPDEGSSYWDIGHNVFSNSSYCADDCQWLHIWTPTIHDIYTHDNYVDTATQDVAGTDTPVVRTTVVPKGTPLDKWPAAARAVMEAAGPGPGMLP